MKEFYFRINYLFGEPPTYTIIKLKGPTAKEAYKRWVNGCDDRFSYDFLHPWRDDQLLGFWQSLYYKHIYKGNILESPKTFFGY